MYVYVQYCVCKRSTCPCGHDLFLEGITLHDWKVLAQGKKYMIGPVLFPSYWSRGLLPDPKFIYPLCPSEFIDTLEARPSGY